MGSNKENYQKFWFKTSRKLQRLAQWALGEGRWTFERRASERWTSEERPNDERLKNVRTMNVWRSTSDELYKLANFGHLKPVIIKTGGDSTGDRILRSANRINTNWIGTKQNENLTQQQKQNSAVCVHHSAVERKLTGAM